MRFSASRVPLPSSLRAKPERQKGMTLLPVPVGSMKSSPCLGTEDCRGVWSARQVTTGTTAKRRVTENLQGTGMIMCTSPAPGCALFGATTVTVALSLQQSRSKARTLGTAMGTKSPEVPPVLLDMS